VLKGRALASSIAVLCLAATAAPAQASVTLGAIPATTPPSSCTNITEDWLMSNQTSGNSYAVPNLVGTITSWRTQTSLTAGQVWTMKVFRHVSGLNYSVVGHDGPKSLAAGKLNSFKTNIAVKPGDLIGMNDNDSSTPVSTACALTSPGNTASWHVGSIAQGQAGTFGSESADSLLNIEATFEPQSRFTVSAVTRNRKRGKAIIALDLPNPGTLTASGAGIETASAAAVSDQTVAAGQTRFRVKATGKKKQKLFNKGRCKVNVSITYTPTSGTARTRHAKFKLIRR